MCHGSLTEESFSTQAGKYIIIIIIIIIIITIIISTIITIIQSPSLQALHRQVSAQGQPRLDGDEQVQRVPLAYDRR